MCVYKQFIDIKIAFWALVIMLLENRNLLEIYSFFLLTRIMKKVVGNRSGCPTQGDKVVELIYIDIVGLTQFKKTLGPSWVHYQ